MRHTPLFLWTEDIDFVNNLQQMWRKTKRSETLETNCVKKFGILFIKQKLEVILGI